MNQSKGLQQVLVRTAFYRQTFRKDELFRKEYLVVGFLQYAQLDEKAKPNMASEIIQVRRILQMKCIQSIDDTLKLVFEVLSKKSNHELAHVKQEILLEKAEKLAIDSHASEVATHHLLHILLEELPTTLKHLFKTKQETELKEVNEKVNALDKALKKVVEEKNKEEKVEKEKIIQEGNGQKLFDLNEKIEEMSEYILKSVKGQDHAVRALAKGYWNAELLSEVDVKRKRPKSIFTFAGPPGVGKTFMAKKMAEYLGLKFLQVDMSRCIDKQSGVQIFQGLQKAYQGGSANRGEVTKFVAENPKSVILFDELEKAHLNVLHLFYQILEEGTLADLYTQEDVSFKDVIIIITTNAGHNLYEGKEEENLSLIPTKKIIQALKKDINPITKEKFFPDALVSRFATGTVLMFNHLQSHNLEDICRNEFHKQKELFENQYGIQVEMDEKLPSLLLYKEGGMCDARSLTAQTSAFFKNELFKCIQLYKLEESFTKNIQKFKFVVNDWENITQLDDIFKKPKQNNILIFGNDTLGNSLKDKLSDVMIDVNSHVQDALKLFECKDIQMVLLDIFVNQPSNGYDSFDGMGAININASRLDEIRKLVEELNENYPYIPIYVLEKKNIDIDDRFLQQLIEIGIRGKIDVKDSKLSTYKNQIQYYLERAYLQGVASSMVSRRKMVKFDVSPVLNENEKTVYLRCRNYSIDDLVDVEDEELIVSDAERPTVKFNDVIGASAAKNELKFFMEFLKEPKKFLARGLKPPKGLLFYGPPGTGKTLLAKAMAGETDITFISESASNIIGNSSANASETIKSMFKRARKYAPAILFIDEIDAIGRTRTGENVYSENALNTLLTELDGFKVNLRKPVFLIAATNFSVDEEDGRKSLDSALVRRFDRKILIDLPSKDERYQLLKMLCGKLDNCQVSDEMIKNIANRALGLSNAILTNVVNQAARDADQKGVVITDEFFEEAFELTVHGEVKDWGKESLERTAWHEAGHAYMYWKHGHTPSYLTIVARGNHGGYMQHDADEATSPIKTKKQMLEDIRVSLAGRASEIIRYGIEEGISTGISGDLQTATRRAKYMVLNCAMDDDLGMIYVDSEMAKSSEMSMMIYQKINQILKEQMEITINEIRNDYIRVERLTNALIDRTSMMGDEIKAVLEEE